MNITIAVVKVTNASIANQNSMNFSGYFFAGVYRPVARGNQRFSSISGSKMTICRGLFISSIRKLSLGVSEMLSPILQYPISCATTLNCLALK